MNFLSRVPRFISEIRHFWKWGNFWTNKSVKTLNKSKIGLPTTFIMVPKRLPRRPIRFCEEYETPRCLRKDLLCKVANVSPWDGIDKVTVVGAGTVGISCANAILFQRISSHVAIVDAYADKLKGECMDFIHGSIFLDDPRIEFNTDYCISSNSRVVIVAAGARQAASESRLDLVEPNTEIMKEIIPPLVAYSPNAVFIVVTNPVDIMSWITWKLSRLPVNRIIGSGCNLDSARFRNAIGQRLGIAAKTVHGFVIGEHGDSQVPLWSGVNVAGVVFRDIISSVGLEADDDGWYSVTMDAIKAGSTIRGLKGYSNTAVGLSIADITKAVLRNSQAVRSVSTLIRGHHGVCDEIFLSLPCTIGENGITHVIRMRMTDYEKTKFQNSATIVNNVQQRIVSQIPKRYL